MSGIFSFLGSPMQNVVKRAHDMLPSIEKVLAVFYDEMKDEQRALIAHRQSDGIKLEEITGNEVPLAFDDFREKPGAIGWYSKDDIPFEIQKKSTSPKIEVFRELENTVLLLRYKNETDGKYDLLFYYFNADTSNFGVSTDNRSLTTEHKTIISTMLYNAVKTQINEHNYNKDMLKVLNNNIQNAIHENKELKLKLENTRKRYQKSIAGLCLKNLKEISEELGVSLRLSAEAMDKLVNYEGDISDIRKIILQAAQFAVTMSMGMGEVPIESSHVNTHVEKPAEEAEENAHTGIREERYAKTRFILDEMEQAARLLSSRSVKLTSENLARSLSKPKSAAAISDQLSKHRDRILRLFDENPEQWTIIRKKFRPIQNIVNK